MSVAAPIATDPKVYRSPLIAGPDFSRRLLAFFLSLHNFPRDRWCMLAADYLLSVPLRLARQLERLPSRSRAKNGFSLIKSHFCVRLHPSHL